MDVLPDDVLLDIFDFHVNMSIWDEDKTKAWQSLVHVCRRWRSLVLGSPRRLNLRIFCTRKTLARDTLNIWPALPLIVQANLTSSPFVTDTETPERCTYDATYKLQPSLTMDDIIAALGQSHRVCKVNLFLEGWQLENVLVAMRVPFPELTDLRVGTYDRTPPIIPDSFLGGSAPRLRRFELQDVTFPELSKLHLSAPHLVRLTITYTHDSWYISSEAMVTLLSALSSLNKLFLFLEFRSPDNLPSRRDRETRRPPPSRRSVIPALIAFFFYGNIDYLENLMTFIDVPRLLYFDIILLDQIDFDTPRLAQFIDFTPALRALDEAHVESKPGITSVGYQASNSGLKKFRINMSCSDPDWQLSSLEHICNSLHSRSTIEDLYIERTYHLVWDNDTIESILWLELLLPFTAVKNLYLSKEFAPVIARALKVLVERRIIITEVLPSLQNIFVEGLEPLGPFQETIGKFVAARQLSGHPIAISIWVNASNEG